MKKNKGITLIALVITIIILIILAAIAINAVFGENGLILRAQEAKFKTEVGVITDLVEVEKINISSTGKITFKEDVLDNLNIVSDQKEKYIGAGKIIYINGKLYYWNGEGAEFDSIQKQWLKDIGIGPYEGSTTPSLEGLKIGDYIEYAPTSATSSTIPSSSSGYGSPQTFSSTGEETDWVILDINEYTGEILLISETPLQGTSYDEGLYLKGAKGYNNAESILNTLCAELYSNTSNYASPILARSVTGEDIDKLTGMTDYIGTSGYKNYIESLMKILQGSDNYEYGVTYTDYEASYRYMPDPSYQPEGYMQKAEGEPFADNQIAYDFIGDFTPPNGKVQEILEAQGRADEITAIIDVLTAGGGDYWLASRVVYALPHGSLFFVRSVWGARAALYTGCDLFISWENLVTFRLPVRPVISLNADIIVKCEGENSSMNKHTIQPYDLIRKSAWNDLYLYLLKRVPEMVLLIILIHR